MHLYAARSVLRRKRKPRGRWVWSSRDTSACHTRAAGAQNAGYLRAARRGSARGAAPAPVEGGGGGGRAGHLKRAVSRTRTRSRARCHAATGEKCPELRDAACPISTGWGTRRVHLVRGGGGGGGRASRGPSARAAGRRRAARQARGRAGARAPGLAERRTGEVEDECGAARLPQPPGRRGFQRLKKRLLALRAREGRASRKGGAGGGAPRSCIGGGAGAQGGGRRGAGVMHGRRRMGAGGRRAGLRALLAVDRLGREARNSRDHRTKFAQRDLPARRAQPALGSVLA